MAAKTVADEQRRLLVDRIKSFPCLYEAKYRGKLWAPEKQRAWYNICKDIGLPILDCQRMWSTLRTVYVTLHRKAQESSDPNAEFEIRWPFYQQMSFIKPHLKSKKRSQVTKPEEVDEPSILSDDSMDLDILQAARIPVPEFVPSLNVADGTSAHTFNSGLTQAEPCTSSTTEKPDVGKLMPLDGIEKPALASPISKTSPAKDDVYHYCMSLVERLRRLPQGKIYRARVAIEKVLYEIEFDLVK